MDQLSIIIIFYVVALQYMTWQTNTFSRWRTSLCIDSDAETLELKVHFGHFNGPEELLALRRVVHLTRM